MGNEQGTSVPAFVWVGILGFVTVLIIYAVRSRQSVEEFEIPGFKAKFRAPQANEAVSVTVAYDREDLVVEGEATILIGSAPEARLSVGPGKKYDAARLRLARSGKYGYRVQVSELHRVYDSTGQEVVANFQMAGDGQLDLVEGSGFKIHKYLQGQPGGAVWHASIIPVGSEKENAATTADWEALERAVNSEK